MTDIPERCITKHTKKEFEVQDRESVVRFNNPEELRIEEVTVDGCVFKDGDGERCDYLVQILQKSATRGNDKSVLVELKGSDMLKAFGQLVATSEALSDDLNKHVWWAISHSVDRTRPQDLRT